MVKPEDEKKVVVGCTVIVISTQKKCSVTSSLERRPGRMDVGGGEKEGETSEVLPPKLPGREIERAEPDVCRARTGSHVEVGEGGKVKVMKLMPTTKEDMKEFTKMKKLKNKINGIAAKVLPEGVLNQEEFKSFKDASEQESNAKDLTELYAEAAEVLQVFAEMMQGIMEGLGMDADKYPEAEGGRIIDDEFEFKALTCAPLKGRKRAEKKIKDDYEGNFNYIIKEKGAIHEYYNFFHDKFSGASASYSEITKNVEALGL
ncbi:hypothetical protein TrLO_g8900 [Triparma laevis f. longispina]|uniref:Uncharacterized protein n=1 Tax=Triparma laevis f. longispina TaxID=1714387 RepID=A0A9W7CE96_9STRA|nr:hypothetical protein TrLO_g8900 [Triparma laevis f. longispina]